MDMVSKRHVSVPVWTQQSHPQSEPQMAMSLTVQVCQQGGHCGLGQLWCYGRRNARAALAEDSKKQDSF